MPNKNLASPEAITPQTQEITVTGFNPNILQLATDSLSKEVELVDVNLSVKNWDTTKINEFPRAVYLGTQSMPAIDDKTGEVKQLECAFFMDNKKDIYFKAAYQFVKAVRYLPVGANFYAKFLSVEKISNGNKAETFLVKQYQVVK